MTRPRDIYGPGFTQDEYLRALAAGYETGWWDDQRHPRTLARRLRRPHTRLADRRRPRRTTTERRRTTLLINKTKDQPIHHSPGLDLHPRTCPERLQPVVGLGDDRIHGGV